MYKWENIQTKTELEFVLSRLKKYIIKNKSIQKIFTTGFECPKIDGERIMYTTQDDPFYILFEDDNCLVIHFYFYSEIHLEYRPINKEELKWVNKMGVDCFNAHHEIYSWNFDESGNRIADSYGIKHIIDIHMPYSPLQAFKVKGFHNSYWKWVYDGEASSMVEIPAGGDYFNVVTIVLGNGIEIDICAEDAEADGYYDLVIRDPNKLLYFKQTEL